ncbi:hypothetical protein, partial [Klebsiella variicola]|uniref:hypothetical protein n=1 Tax=Klebsiella variicola TaxID=244366 RepID=UPI001C46CB6F
QPPVFTEYNGMSIQEVLSQCHSSIWVVSIFGVFGAQEKRRRIIAGESQKKQNCCYFRIIAFKQKNS